MLLCGRYEGFDDRVRQILEPDEISIGDVVLGGGEVAAMVLIDAVARLIPGVLGDGKATGRIRSRATNPCWSSNNTPGRVNIAATKCPTCC